jgi:hypothetical protein
MKTLIGSRNLLLGACLLALAPATPAAGQTSFYISPGLGVQKCFTNQFLRDNKQSVNTRLSTLNDELISLTVRLRRAKYGASIGYKGAGAGLSYRIGSSTSLHTHSESYYLHSIPVSVSTRVLSVAHGGEQRAAGQYTDQVDLDVEVGGGPYYMTRDYCYDCGGAGVATDPDRQYNFLNQQTELKNRLGYFATLATTLRYLHAGREKVYVSLFVNYGLRPLLVGHVNYLDYTTPRQTDVALHGSSLGLALGVPLHVKTLP